MNILGNIKKSVREDLSDRGFSVQFDDIIEFADLINHLSLEKVSEAKSRVSVNESVR